MSFSSLLLAPFLLFLRPFLFLFPFLRVLFDVTSSAQAMGGPRGAVKAFLTLLRRWTPLRPDGLQLTTTAAIDGVRFPWTPWRDVAGWRATLNGVAEMKLREDDVFVISYPKCGHHFLHEVLNMILVGQTNLHPDQKFVNFLEFYSDPQTYFGRLPSPRVIMTHLPLKFLPRELWAKRCKIIRISRNPKDVFVSYYHHNLAVNYRSYTDPLENYIKLHLDDPCDAEYGSYFHYERQYEEKVNHLDHVIRLTFESLKKDTAQVVKKIARFLGVERGDEFYRQVALETDFAKVQRVKGGKTPFTKDGRSLYRRGVAGDWRRFITVALNEEIDAKIEKEWRGSGLENLFDYGEKIKKL